MHPNESAFDDERKTSAEIRLDRQIPEYDHPKNGREDAVICDGITPLEGVPVASARHRRAAEMRLKYTKVDNSSKEALERHYSIKEIADSWGLCENAVREIFRNEPGVMRIHRPKSRHKRAYTTLRIPQTVLERVHCRMSVFV